MGTFKILDAFLEEMFPDVNSRFGEKEKAAVVYEPRPVPGWIFV